MSSSLQCLLDHVYIAAEISGREVDQAGPSLDPGDVGGHLYGTVPEPHRRNVACQHDREAAMVLDTDV